jgi:pimeloyl-ACP methyl ester carboxylesterase/DNA-binding CsgD family transcriptional regulator
VRRAMGLSAAEARVAATLADGGSAGDAAAALGISEATVKSYRRSVFAKTGVNRSRDLRRLISEVSELDRLASASEVRADTQGSQERLRLILSRGRRVAFIDYGPASGTPLVIGHGFTTGRLVPAPFLARCHRAGYRVIIPQRPGFGLTDAAGDDYLGTAADDLAAILDSLGAPVARTLMRDGGAASLLTFAQRYPERLDRPVLFNPRPPRGFGAPPTAPMAAISGLLRSHPNLIEPFAEMLRRQTRSDVLEAMIRRTCSAADPDRMVIEQDPTVVAHVVRDMQGLMARTTRGFVAEHQVYVAGWSPPGLPPGPTWTLAYSTALIDDPDLRPWAGLPGLRTVRIEGAGLLAVYSHGAEVLALLD